MKRGEFDLTGKAVDCGGLYYLGDAGREIFRSIFISTGIKVSPDFNMLAGLCVMLSPNGSTGYILSPVDSMRDIGACVIQPSDVLGQAAIDAAMDGATIVFEGDVVPSGVMVRYWSDGAKENVNQLFELKTDINPNVIAYKMIESKVNTINSPLKSLSDAVDRAFPNRTKPFTTYKALTDDEICKVSGLMDEGLSKEDIIDKLGLSRESKADYPPSFEELKHVDSDVDWDAREEEVYGCEEVDNIEELLDSSDSDIIGRLIQELQFRHAPYSPSVLIDSEGAVKLYGCGITIDVSACEAEDIGRYYDALTVLGEVV